jgi:cytidylate kinase
MDTGIMYRAVARYALDREIDLDDEAAVARLAEDPALVYRFDTGQDVAVEIDGRDVSGTLRTVSVDRGASTVATLALVRVVLVDRQRSIAGEASIVMVGRDIGTVVLRDAELKVFLTASAEERAKRRHIQNQETGVEGSYEEILAALEARDRNDSGRAASPLMVAEGAVEVDSTDMSLDEVIETISKLAMAAG